MTRARPDTDQSNVSGYRHPSEHLADEIEVYRMMLAAALERRLADEPEGARLDYRGVMMTRLEARQAAYGDVGAERLFPPDVSRTRSRVNERVAATQGVRLPIPGLQTAFGLDAVSMACLMLAVAVDLDPRIWKVVAYLQDDIARPHLTPELLFGIFGQTWQTQLVVVRALHGDSPLRRAGLIRLIERGAAGPAAWLRTRIELHPAVLPTLIGQRIDRFGLVRRLPSDAGAEAESRGACLGLADAVRRAASEHDRMPVVVVEGPATLVDDCVEDTCRHLSIDRYRVDCQDTPESIAALVEGVEQATQVARLQACALELARFDALERGAAEERRRPRAVDRVLGDFPGLLFISGDGLDLDRSGFDQRALLRYTPGPADRAARVRAWSAHLTASAVDVEPVTLAEELADRAQLGPSAMTRALDTARDTALLRAGSGEVRITRADIEEAVRAESRVQVQGARLRPTTGYGWGDLKLPDAVARQVRTIPDFIRHRDRLTERWGLDARRIGSRGIVALFAGPSGTGKTMAAELIAKDLCADLLVVDLGQLVSKYIGETEKNLSRVFRAARHSGAVLFFDEADALFGRRTEVRDSNDRHANLETGHLLQEIEAHPGVCILATNLRGNLDDAFIRRIQVYVQFPRPDVATRSRLWATALGARMPYGADVDHAWLARRFDFTGGDIKNAALYAAFLAARSGTEHIELDHLIEAIWLERFKAGEKPQADDFDPHTDRARQLMHRDGPGHGGQV